MPKPARDEVGAREMWIQERLGERKYRQLRMHLSGALRLLGELAVMDSVEPMQPGEHRAQNLAERTTKAVADLTQRLQELSSKRPPIRVRKLQAVKSKRRRRTQRSQ